MLKSNNYKKTTVCNVSKCGSIFLFLLEKKTPEETLDCIKKVACFTLEFWRNVSVEIRKIQ